MCICSIMILIWSVGDYLFFFFKPIFIMIWLSNVFRLSKIMYLILVKYVNCFRLFSSKLKQCCMWWTVCDNFVIHSIIFNYLFFCWWRYFVYSTVFEWFYYLFSWTLAKLNCIFFNLIACLKIFINQWLIWNFFRKFL